MTILDVNILLYAYDTKARQHAAAAKWLRDLLKSDEQIGLPCLTIWAFIRLSTSPRILTHPFTAEEAASIVREWSGQPGISILQPGPRHFEFLERLMIETGTVGSLVTDAALAAFAIENGAALASTDQDFRRFPQLRWVNPLA